jgi:hypothetical protein
MLRTTERVQDETEMYRRMMENTVNNLRVAAPGIIRSFDADKQTAVVQIAIREKINIKGRLQWTDIPLLVDVPVVFPKAGDYALTLPVKKDDECLVIFADFCIDAWWQSGGIQNQLDKRRHDLSDGFALVGVSSQPKKITNYSANTIQLRNKAGDTYVEINENNINIVAAENTTVNCNNASITCSGNVTIDSGSVTIGSNTVIDGKNFLNHTHSGILSGHDNTGGVV